MTDVYNKSEDMAFECGFDNAVTGFLSETKDYFPTAPLTDTSVRKRIKLLNLYRQAVEEYATLADDGFTGKQNAFSKCCQNIQKSYENFGDSMATVYAKSINSYLKSSRYDQNNVTKLLLNALQEIWQKDVESLNLILNGVFDNFQTALAAVPDKSFSEEKLIKYVYQPYDGKHNLVAAYKLNLIKAKRGELKKLVQSQDNISEALACVNSALTEFLKKDCDKTAVKDYLKKIDILLESQEDNED
jgi:molecular chaperone GrpE (heat shock protein)